MKSFIRGTFILMLAIFISKLLGFIFRIQFIRIAGEEAVGIYMTAYPAFIFFLSLVQLGIPVAIAKIIAALDAKGQSEKIQSVMKSAAILTFFTAIAFIPAAILFIPFLAETLLENEFAVYTLYTSIIIIPIAAVGGLIRGYFQGITKIEETAWSQLLEQTLRIAFITWMLPIFYVDHSPALNAAFAMGITLLAEIASVSYLAYKYRQYRKRQTVQTTSRERYPLEPILSIALPASGSKLFGTFTWFLEPIIFLRALTVSGLSAVQATTLYGIISGVFIPLLLFPSFIPYALAVVLIPAVSSAIAANHVKKLQTRIQLALRLSAITGTFAAVIFFLHGQLFAEQLFNVSDDGQYMKLLAPVFFFYYIQSPLYAILQAIGEAKAGMLNSIYGGVAKLGVMFILASQPGLQETGAVLAIGFGVLVTSFLHIATLRKHPMSGSGFSMFITPYFAFILAIIIRPIFLPLYNSLWKDAIITTGFLVVILFLLNQIRYTDLKYLKKLIQSQR